MGVNVKIGNNTISNVDTIKLKNADNPSAYYSFSLGQELNIHFDPTIAPTDTSKLWVKTNSPNSVSISKEITIESTDSCSTLDISLPSAITNYSGVAKVDDNIYWIGGSTTTTSIYRYNITAGTITQMNGTLPAGRSQPGCAAVGSKIYIFGGGSDGYARSTSKTIYCYDITTDSVRTVNASLPEGRAAVTCIAVGDYIYLFGGGATGDYDLVGTSNIYRFNTVTESIITLPIYLPDSVIHTSAAAVGTNVWLFGGDNCFNAAGASTTRINQVSCFNASNETVTRISQPFSTGVSSLACAAIGSKIYLFGGQEGNGKKVQCWDSQSLTLSTLSAELPSTISTGSICSSNLANGTEVYLLGNYRILIKYTAIASLQQNTLLILDNYGSNSFKLFGNTGMQIDVYPNSVFLGNSNNQAQKVAAALYDGSSWQGI